MTTNQRMLLATLISAVQLIIIQVGETVLKLKPQHVYYSQIQGQLAITEGKWCDFVVFANKGLSVERINFDPDHYCVNS